MSIQDNLLQSSIKHLSELLSGHLESFKDPELKKSVWAANGIVLPDDAEDPPVSDQTLKNIEAYQNAVDPDLLAFYNALEDVKQIIDSLQAVAEAYHTDGGWGTADELSRQVLTELTFNYTRFRFPTLFHLMRALRFLEDKLDNHYYLTPEGGEKDDRFNRSLFWHRFTAFLFDIGGYFKETFNSLHTEEDARQLADFFYLPTAAALGFVLGDKGIIANYHWDASPDSTTPKSDALADRTLSVLIPFPDLIGDGADGSENASGNRQTDLDAALFISSVFVPREHGGPGVLLSVGGASEADIPITLPFGNDADKEANGQAADETEFVLHLELDTPAGGTLFIPLGKDSDFDIASAGKSMALKATFEPKGDYKNRLLGSRKGSRLELGKPQFSLHFRKLPNHDDFLFETQFVLKKSALVIAPTDGDSFIKDVLPAGDAGITMDLGIGVRKAEDGDWGAYLVGGDSLEVTLPGDKKLGPADFKELTTRLNPQSRDGTGSQAQSLRAASPQALTAQAETQDGLIFETTATVTVQLGPVTTTLDQVGFKLSVRSAEDGNLGLFDVDLGYKAPEGVGLALDTGTIFGGGYLEFDPEKEQYSGVVQLQFEQLTFTAIGLLTTRMPDGTDGFSLLLILSADDFPPVELGLGFKLTGIGGLLGFNRTVAMDVLQAGLKNKTLDRVLFPKDPVKNATSIVSTLRRVFPPAPDQYVLGPIAELSWGKEGLLTAKVGILLEFPDPVRLILLGQMRAVFPSKQKALVQLNMDVFGAIDFDKGEAILLATLFDSKLMKWNVSGDAAFFARWQGDALFILSAGGFHPAFAAPPELPSLARLAMVLSQGKKLQLRMTWYLALTSNTLQHGSRVDLHVSAASFSVDGHLSYDVLVQFDPFGFLFLFSAGVGLKWHGRTLASVQLAGTLSGPSPWHIKGKATFKIWRFSKSVSFDRTLGQAETLPPLPVVDPKPVLLAALADPINWEAQLPQYTERLVVFRETRAVGVVKVHPLGKVSVRQQVVPLNEPISKFGNARTEHEQAYRITGGGLGGETDRQRNAPLPPVFEQFAPGQFKELSQAARLSSPSFQTMEAGVALPAGERFSYGDGAHRRSKPLNYKTKVFLETADEAVEAETYQPGDNTLSHQVVFGAASHSRQGKSGLRRYAVSQDDVKELVSR
ncbi:MAG: DUF6603 domain-containing protein [Cyanobacteria bacterium J06635_1]